MDFSNCNASCNMCKSRIHGSAIIYIMVDSEIFNDEMRDIHDIKKMSYWVDDQFDTVADVCKDLQGVLKTSKPLRLIEMKDSENEDALVPAHISSRFFYHKYGATFKATPSLLPKPSKNENEINIVEEVTKATKNEPVVSNVIVSNLEKNVKNDGDDDGIDNENGYKDTTLKLKVTATASSNSNGNETNINIKVENGEDSDDTNIMMENGEDFDDETNIKIENVEDSDAIDYDDGDNRYKDNKSKITEPSNSSENETQKIENGGDYGDNQDAEDNDNNGFKVEPTSNLLDEDYKILSNDFGIENTGFERDTTIEFVPNDQNGLFDYEHGDIFSFQLNDNSSGPYEVELGATENENIENDQMDYDNDNEGTKFEYINEFAERKELSISPGFIIQFNGYRPSNPYYVQGDREYVNHAIVKGIHRNGDIYIVYLSFVEVHQLLCNKDLATFPFKVGPVHEKHVNTFGLGPVKYLVSKVESENCEDPLAETDQRYDDQNILNYL